MGLGTDDRVIAVITENAASLLRIARKHSLCADDAHDAYQRTLEIYPLGRRGACAAHDRPRRRRSVATRQPEVDAALDFYNTLVDHVRGKIANASNAAELNAALHSVLAGAWMSLDAKGQFYATFRLRPDSEPLKRGVLPEFGHGPVYELDWGAPRRRRREGVKPNATLW